LKARFVACERAGQEAKGVQCSVGFKATVLEIEWWRRKSPKEMWRLLEGESDYGAWL